MANTLSGSRGHVRKPRLDFFQIGAVVLISACTAAGVDRLIWAMKP